MAVDFEIGSVAGIVPVMCVSPASVSSLKGTCLYWQSGRQTDLQIDVEGRGRGGGFGRRVRTRTMGTRLPRDLEHVKVAVAVSGVERLDGHADQEIALAAWQTPLPFAAWLTPSL